MRTYSRTFCAFTVLFLITFSNVFAQKGYTITGAIKGLDSGVIKLYNEKGGPQDSALISNGRFILKGYTAVPKLRGFTVSPGNYAFQMFLENTDMSLNLDTANARFYASYMIVLTRVEVKGSAINEAYERFKTETRQEQRLAEALKINAQLKNTTDRVASSNLRKMLDSIPTALFAAQKDWLRQYITENPASPAAPFLFNEYYQHFFSEFNTTPPLLEWALSKFTGAAKESAYYSELLAASNGLKNRETNRSIPEITLLQPSKKPFHLSSTKGKYVMLDFWASWCVPCRAAIPHWKDIYKKYHTKGLEIVSIASERKWTDWTTALNKEKMPWVQLLDEKLPDSEKTKASDLFEIHFIPFYVLLDKEGKVILASGDEDAITQKIESLL